MVRAAAAAPPTAPTPCAGWDLAALVRHLLYWAPFLAAAGRRAEPVPVAEREEDVVLAGWPDTLATAHADVVAAWSDPAAWEGTTSMGGPDRLPAPMIGGMVLGELVVHGWDLARAAGVRPEWPDGVLAPARDAVAGMAEQGRAMGVFGPEVAVPADAGLLAATLALTGRDPDGA
ncbi:TIGR03086 family protein [Pseudonocardia sp. CNS-139]|nr:TIGR03086 family protein [Pseudonocardia sp. CNS-139]